MHLIPRHRYILPSLLWLMYSGGKGAKVFAKVFAPPFPKFCKERVAKGENVGNKRGKVGELKGRNGE